MIEPLLVPRESFDDPDAAVDRVRQIYQAGVDHLRRHLHDFVAGQTPAAHVRACYPSVRVHTDTVARADSVSSYGFVAGKYMELAGSAAAKLLLLSQKFVVGDQLPDGFADRIEIAMSADPRARVRAAERRSGAAGGVVGGRLQRAGPGDLFRPCRDCADAGAGGGGRE